MSQYRSRSSKCNHSLDSVELTLDDLNTALAVVNVITIAVTTQTPTTGLSQYRSRSSKCNLLRQHHLKKHPERLNTALAVVNVILKSNIEIPEGICLNTALAVVNVIILCLNNIRFRNILHSQITL